MAENYITCSDEKGSINISEDVIAVMVAAAIAEVDAVAGLTNTVGGELAEFLGRKSVSKGVKVQFADDRITIDAIIVVKFGCAVADVARKVQEGVAAAVESMTGMGEPIVNIHVSGVAFDKNDGR